MLNLSLEISHKQVAERRKVDSQIFKLIGNDVIAGHRKSGGEYS